MPGGIFQQPANGPIDNKRQRELQKLFASCTAGPNQVRVEPVDGRVHTWLVIRPDA